ncbi:MAG: hypothetical protein OYG31_00770 [Candidatus Kaiserbacteria bacterium]|nr:hypothetical protein [Candidatus Kaiserbacteria bacterium]
MKNIFTQRFHRTIEKQVQDFLSSHPNFLSQQTINSPRAVGDAIQTVLEKNFREIVDNALGTDASTKEPSASFTRRAMADIAFYDKDNNYYVVDVKTHRLDTEFNMPNLTSVERLSRLYEDDKNNFVILKIDYEIMNKKFAIKRTLFRPIEFFAWSCLTLGALGWGQIQIANANEIEVKESYSRKEWMLEMCDRLFEFYPKEIEKINERIGHFQKVRAFWKDKNLW